MDKYFKASSWDPLLQFITVGVSLFALAFMYYNPNAIVILAMAALILVPALFMVRGYSIKEHTLVIHRLGWTNEFDIHDLVNIEINSQALRGSWRLFGNGGLFGWIGTFKNKELGTFRAYATNRRKCVVLKLKNRTLLITPDSPGAFVDSVQASVQE